MDPLTAVLLVLFAAIVIGCIAKDERSSQIQEENKRLRGENHRLRRAIATPRRNP